MDMTAILQKMPALIGVFSLGALMLSGGWEGRKLNWRALLNPGAFAALGPPHRLVPPSAGAGRHRRSGQRRHPPGHSLFAH